MSRALNKQSVAIRTYILKRLALIEEAKTVIPDTQQQFDVTRKTVHRHLMALVANGDVLAHGKTKSRTYSLACKSSKDIDFSVTSETEEHIIWERSVRPLIADLKPNVLDICHHGVTEMVNNVKDHSESQDARVTVYRTAVSLTITVLDKGVGIFTKIQKDFNLHDPRHALLELSKGKLTSDADNHSGEGIFFTSRMFDRFYIRSGRMLYAFSINDNEDYLIETTDKVDIIGTRIIMCITFDSERDSSEVFDKYTTGDDDHQFSKTHVPVDLASYENDQLVSRSSAKRVLARFNRFKQVWLDFQGVDKIGQAFADEIFRVYAKAHPEISFTFTNAVPNVEKMILRAMVKAHEELAEAKNIN